MCSPLTWQLAPQQALQQIPPPRHRASSTTYIQMNLIVHLRAVITVVYIFFQHNNWRYSMDAGGLNVSYNHSVFILNCFVFADRFWIKVAGANGSLNRKLEHTVIVLKSVFDASPALATVTHPQLFHCVVPWCFSACVSIHHVCACCTKADPLQNRLRSVIYTELSLTTGWPWHYSDGDCLTNKHFRFTSAGSSQCCCSGYT